MKLVSTVGRKAYFIVGPESAGNRMMAKAIASTKEFGDGGFEISDENKFIFKERWVYWANKYDIAVLDDALDNSPDEIIYVASVPTRPPGGKIYPNIAASINAIVKHSYRVFPVVMYRDIRYTVKSQVGRGHAHNAGIAYRSILSAYDFIFSEMARINVFPLVVKYEEFVANPNYRSFTLRKMLDLPNTAQMEFFNANEKYK